MDTKMKGLFKGLRYISQIFDSKEPEMQIGYPTDVKHVAHIGWDNQASTNGPSWMTDFKSDEPSPRNSGPANWPPSGFGNDFEGRELTEERQPSRVPRRTSSGESASPKHDMSASTRQTQRRHSSSSGGGGGGGGGGYADSPTREPVDASRQSRKSRSSAGNSGESPQPDGPALPKQNRRRKTKGSSGSGSIKSKSKGAVSAPDDEPAAITRIAQMLTARGEDTF